MVRANRVSSNKYCLVAICAFASAAAIASSACSHDGPVSAPKAAPAPTREPREPVLETPHTIESTPYHARLERGAQLYLPSSFMPRDGGYDVVFHFHGIEKIQQRNVEETKLNAALINVNLGVGTTPYSRAFRDVHTFERLLESAQAEIERSGRATDAKVRRIALSAWSAGFVAVSRILADPARASRVDAVLLADGFFTSFSDVKKRIINEESLARFVSLTTEATRDEKLFALTHSAIPTPNYPSVAETVTKLLELASLEKKPTDTAGPRGMHEQYAVDVGSFHVHGYEGVRAGDHVKHIQAMGETLLPYLKARWQPPLDPRAEAGQTRTRN